jgi:hypothetical protein
MLQLRPSCECCDRALAPVAAYPASTERIHRPGNCAQPRGRGLYTPVTSLNILLDSLVDSLVDSLTTRAGIFGENI